MGLTPAQTDAKTAKGRALLVSAAAGSGKTFTLTQRIIDTILHDKNKSISRMLIVTFTRSAAGELKKKIADALSKAIDSNPDDDHLKEELINLGSAHISTIDSFFSAPVKANFEKLGLPASMRLADDAELAPIRNEIFREVLEQFFASKTSITEGELDSVGSRNAYTDLLSLISGVRDSSGLIPTLTSYYYKLLSSPDGVDKLRKSAERLKNSADLDFFDTLEGSVVKEQIQSTVKYTILQLQKTVAKIPEIADAVLENTANEFAEGQARAILEKSLTSFDDDLTKCISLDQKLSGSYRSAKEAIDDFKFANYASIRKDDKSPEAEELKNQRTKIIQPVKDLKSTLLYSTEEEISSHFEASAEICEVLYLLLKRFDERYSNEKISRGISEFSDMPKFMLKLLLNDDGTPTAIASSMARDFDEVYIDEYQDVNAIQDKIFEIIGGNRRFMVGDIKQSIYGFRDAEPGIFAAYRESFAKYDRNNPNAIPASGGNSIFMSENFRCDKTVIEFSNAVCSTIFNAFADSIGYDDEKDKLRFAKYDENDPHVVIPKMHKVKVTLIQPPKPPADDEASADSVEGAPHTATAEEEEDIDMIEAEARFTANEISRLIRDKNEKNADGTSIKAGNIAILVRGHSLIPYLTDALSKAGIKYVTTAKNELLKGSDMKTLVDLLSVIDNPRDDIPLCRVLTSQLGRASAILDFNELVAIRRQAMGGTLYDALLGLIENDDALAQKCKDFTSALDELRILSAKVSAEKLLRAVSKHPLFSSLCDTDSYTYLYNSACSFSKNSWNGLYSFLSFFKATAEKGSSGSEPVKAQEDEVTIITMHQSKGLEYNVCFLFGLGGEFNLMDLRKPLIFSRDFGLSMKLPAPFSEESDVFEKAQRKREENLLWKSATLFEKDRLLEEEARIFYVALTRARERLYLSATLSKSYDDQLEDQLKNCYDVLREVKNSKSYIKWTLLALSRLGRSNEFFNLEAICVDEVPPIISGLTEKDVKESNYGITEDDKLFATILNDPHGETDEEKLLSMIPAKVAASKVSDSMLEKSIFIPIPTGMLFTESDEDTSEQSSDNMELIKRRINLMRSGKNDFESLLEVNKKPTAAEKGSATHLFLQFCNYTNVENLGIDAEIDRLLNDHFITRRTAEIIDRKQLEGFFKSELFSLIKQASSIKREFRFGMFRSASDFTSKQVLKDLVADKKIFVQGSIDLLIETKEGEIILCDYKTDRVTAEERDDDAKLIKNMKDKHGAQLEEYRFAVNQIFGKDPSRIYIYSVPLGKVIEI